MHHIDETQIKIGSELIWLWVGIESETKNIVAINISKERNMFVAERFLDGLTKEYGRHPVSTDGGTWYPQASRFLKPKYHLHSSLKKSLIERKIQYIKDRTDGFDNYFLCRKKKCISKHIRNWFNLFISQHNKQIMR